VTTGRKAGQAFEQSQQRLEEQKNALHTARDRELHQLCERIVKDTPTLLENAVTEVCNENPLLKKACQQGKALFEMYQEKTMLRVMVDQYLMEHDAERFRAIRKRYEVQLAALKGIKEARTEATT